MGDGAPPSVTGTCSCGERLDACPFWTEVRDRVGIAGKDWLLPTRPQVIPGTNWNGVLIFVLSLSLPKLGVRLPSGNFADSYRRFLDVCHEFHDFDVLVDGFKDPVRYLALKASGFSVKGAVHLLRDPRAFVASAKRSGQSVDAATEDWCVSHEWIARCLAHDSGQAIQVKYEDLCAKPTEILDNLQAVLGLERQELQRPLDPDTHWLGNVSMLDFSGAIRERQRWRDELSPQDVAHIARRTGPTAHRFGYEL